ncbi:hypothetical protein E4U33_002499 [Claviceps sp. LM78 group G4]|nr:hypothetical protein E4U33_002499 [Claviceps sp. LM78 group G4]
MVLLTAWTTLSMAHAESFAVQVVKNDQFTIMRNSSVFFCVPYKPWTISADAQKRSGDCHWSGGLVDQGWATGDRAASEAASEAARESVGNSVIVRLCLLVFTGLHWFSLVFANGVTCES